MTPKEKLDQALGIDSSESIDDFLEDISIDSEGLQKSKEAVESIDHSLKMALDEVDNSIVEYSKSKTDEAKRSEAVSGIESSLEEIGELVTVTKQIIKHIYNNIISTDLLDAELIEAASNFIKTAHENISEYIGIYKDRLKFYDKIQFEMIQHEHKKELLQMKYKLEAQNSPSGITGTAENMKVYSQEDIVKAMKDLDSK